MMDLFTTLGLWVELMCDKIWKTDNAKKGNFYTELPVGLYMQTMWIKVRGVTYKQLDRRLSSSIKATSNMHASGIYETLIRYGSFEEGN